VDISARLDPGVSFRLVVVAVVSSFLLVAGLIAAYSANPDAFRAAVSRPLDTILRRYYWVMFAGVALYVIARLCGVKHRQSLWVFCLSAPGALTMPATFIAALAAGTSDAGEVMLELLIHPATWIMPIVAVRQWFLLQRPENIHVLAGLARTLLVIVAYLFAAFV
jgi:hypothetical protein